MFKVLKIIIIIIIIIKIKIIIINKKTIKKTTIEDQVKLRLNIFKIK